MDAQDQLFRGALVGVTFHAHRVRREGWTLLVTRTWEFERKGALDNERYTGLTRGELLDVLDALRELLGVGSEFGA